MHYLSRRSYVVLYDLARNWPKRYRNEKFSSFEHGFYKVYLVPRSMDVLNMVGTPPDDPENEKNLYKRYIASTTIRYQIGSLIGFHTI